MTLPGGWGGWRLGQTPEFRIAFSYGIKEGLLKPRPGFYLHCS